MTEEECNAARRERPVWRFADGRIAWFNGARLTIGDVEVPELRHGCYPCGLGLESGTPNGYYDFGRERYFASRALGLRGERVWIRPGAWLTRKREDYRLFDPDTKAFAPALGFAGEDEVCAILDDGRVAAFRRGEGMLLVAPETGDLTRLAMPPGFEGGGALERFRAPARTPGGRRVFMLCKDGRIESPPTPYLSAYARLDGDALVATAAVEASISLLGCPTDDTVLVHDGRAIYRLRFGSDVKEEIWRVR